MERLGNVFMAIYETTVVVLVSGNVAVSGNWTFVNSGDTGFAMQPVNFSTYLLTYTSALTQPLQGIVYLHFVADARLGIV